MWRRMTTSSGSMAAGGAASDTRAACAPACQRALAERGGDVERRAPARSSTARSITAAISRTLPGHRYSASTRTSSSETGTGAKAEPVRGALGEVLGERADVARAVAQRRDDDREHRQPVVEIFAKGLRLDHRRQVAVRGGDDADVDAHGPLAADADHLAVLHDAQQPDLRGEARARRLRRGTACRRRPARTSPCGASSAPVNAPCSWPKSSESISSGAIAPQFTRRNGPLRKVECSWMARATISLPVPVSPKSSTGALLRDTMRARAITAARPVSPPISRSSPTRGSPSMRWSGGRRAEGPEVRMFL